MSKYLRPIPSQHFRTRIRKAARRRGFVMGRIGADNKSILADAIFEVENEREHSCGHRDAAVVAMRAVRNRLYDDLGWNESPRVQDVYAMAFADGNSDTTDLKSNDRRV